MTPTPIRLQWFATVIAALVVAGCSSATTSPTTAATRSDTLAPATATLATLGTIPADHDRLTLVVAANPALFADTTSTPQVKFVFGVYGGLCPSGQMCATTWAVLDTGEIISGDDAAIATSAAVSQEAVDALVGAVDGIVSAEASSPDAQCAADMDGSSVFIIRNVGGVEVFDECDTPFDPTSPLVTLVRSWIASAP
jgi:hypothetical protein